MLIIAIDGPGGAGKSTVSRALAFRLGMERLDTGAMYRAVALSALRHGVDLHDGARLGELAAAMRLEVAERVLLDGEDVSDAIRTPEIEAAVATVATQLPVREELVRRQRAWAASRGGGVIEGRDIGSVVFPHATAKIFLTASEAVRAARRVRERVGEGAPAGEEIDVTREAIARRDEIDSTRAASPLLTPEGAVVIDSSSKSVDEVVEEIVALL